MRSQRDGGTTFPVRERTSAAAPIANILPVKDSRALSLFIPAALTVLALALRLIALNAKDFWADEAASVMIAQLPWHDFWRLLAHTEANMSLYYSVLKLWIHLGDGPIVVRILSVIFGAAAVPFTYLLGRDLLSRTAGWIAALLLSINVFHMEYSQQARGYSLAVLLCTLSCWLFLKLMRAPDAPNKGIGPMYIAVSALALYAHFFSALVLLAQAASLPWLRGSESRNASRVFRYQLAILFLALPLVIFVTLNQDRPMWMTRVAARDVFHLLIYLTGSGVVFALYVVAIGLVVWRLGRPELDRIAFLFLWLALPIALTLLLSYWKPLFSPRFLLICLPAPQLLAGYGLAKVSSLGIRTAVIAAVVAASVSGIASYYHEPGAEDWRGTVHYLAVNAGAADQITFKSDYCKLALDYYLAHTSEGMPQIRAIDRSAVSPDASTHQAGDLWVVSCDLASGNNGRQEPVEGVNYIQIQSKNLSGLRIAEFRRRR